jgi:acetyltransferase-like isoleucine patch superfamily enzyme
MYIFDKIQRYILNKKVKKEGGQAFSPTLRKLYSDKYNISIGYGSYGGCFNKSYIPPGTVFGNYCSIAKGVKIFRANHPSNYFTLHPIFYNPVMGYVKKDMLERPAIQIGHDVWIGSSSIILPSVKNIGNGAIIGAGSIVTKDVPPYAVVAGNPAKLIKLRFSPDVIAKLEKSRWWNLNKDDLIKRKEILEKIVNGF